MASSSFLSPSPSPFPLSLPLACREMAVKFNDYFEFPREFDMAPYTAAHLAKVEGRAWYDVEGCYAVLRGLTSTIKLISAISMLHRHIMHA